MTATLTVTLTLTITLILALTLILIVTLTLITVALTLPPSSSPSPWTLTILSCRLPNNDQAHQAHPTCLINTLIVLAILVIAIIITPCYSSVRALSPWLVPRTPHAPTTQA